MTSQAYKYMHTWYWLRVLQLVVRGDKGVAGGGEGGDYSTIQQPMDAEIASDAILRQNSSSSYMAGRVLHPTLAVLMCICQARYVMSIFHDRKYWYYGWQNRQCWR